MQLPANAHVAVIDGDHFLLLRNRGTSAAPALESEGHPPVDETSDPAAGAAEWLNRAVLSHRIEQLVVVGDGETLAAMRDHYHRDTAGALLGELDRGLLGTDMLRAIEAA